MQKSNSWPTSKHSEHYWQLVQRSNQEDPWCVSKQISNYWWIAILSKQQTRFLKKFLRGSDHTHPHTQSWIITFSHLKHYWNGKRNENNGYLEYCLNLIWGDIKSIDSWKDSLHIVFHKVENNTAVSWQIGKMTSYDKLLSAFWNLNVLL